MLVTERYPYRPYTGWLRNHFGRLTLRDPVTLKVVESFSCDGLHPHDLQFLDDGRHVAVANYGSTRNRDPTAFVPEIVEPSITVIELAGVRLVDKIIVSRAGTETRHFAAVDSKNCFAVQVAESESWDGMWASMDRQANTVRERDRLSQAGEIYLPAPLLHVSCLGAGLARVARRALTGDATLMCQGLSILYEPLHRQIVTIFPSAHTVVADAGSGGITRVLRTDEMGLRYTCGLALHPDGRRYIVAGSFENIYLFDRASHALEWEACRYLPLFRHSHIAVT